MDVEVEVPSEVKEFGSSASGYFRNLYNNGFDLSHLNYPAIGFSFGLLIGFILGRLLRNCCCKRRVADIPAPDRNAPARDVPATNVLARRRCRTPPSTTSSTSTTSTSTYSVRTAPRKCRHHRRKNMKRSSGSLRLEQKQAVRDKIPKYSVQPPYFPGLSFPAPNSISVQPAQPFAQVFLPTAPPPPPDAAQGTLRNPAPTNTPSNPNGYDSVWIG